MMAVELLDYGLFCGWIKMFHNNSGYILTRHRLKTNLPKISGARIWELKGGKYSEWESSPNTNNAKQHSVQHCWV